MATVRARGWTWRSLAVGGALALVGSLLTPLGATAGDLHRSPRAPELSEATRLADRRAVVIGDRLYATSTADGLYPAMGFHTRREMGGIWFGWSGEVTDPFTRQINFQRVDGGTTATLHLQEQELEEY